LITLNKPEFVPLHSQIPASLKYSNDQSLGSAIKEFLQAYRLEDKFNQTKLIHSWEKVAGKMVAKHTKDLHIRNKVLFVKIDSPALRNELSYARESIVKSLNEEVKASVIEDIVFI
jgi:predicted nucleic acid-binding Zn ribbon protein